MSGRICTCFWKCISISINYECAQIPLDLTNSYKVVQSRDLVDLVQNMSISEGLNGRHIDAIASHEAGGKEKSNLLEVPLLISNEVCC